jgi:uncharacterized protein (TIGR00297 family)
MPVFLSSPAGRIVAGALTALLIAGVAHRRHALSNSGSAAAVFVAALCSAAGFDWAFMLIAFFLAGTALSAFRRDFKRSATGDVVEKSGARDALQVFANGGPLAAAAVGSLLWPSDVWPVLGAGAIAASSADTWGTEIGTLSRRLPRSITSWQRVHPGASGGITALGTIASLAGAAFIALVTFLMGWPGRSICAALVGGFGGSLVDSVLGGTVQARRWCHDCERATERAVHVCGSPTRVSGGLSWIDNDVVNVLSSIAGAAIGALCLLGTTGRYR